jgi:hypothetical protein
MNVVIVASTKAGVRTVLASTIVARGVFNGVGRIVEVDNLPGDPDNVKRGTVEGGTGRFANASGSFAGSLVGYGFLPRAADGTCDETQSPQSEVDVIQATGTLSF